MRSWLLLSPILLLCSLNEVCSAQEIQSVNIQVQFDHSAGTLSPVWNFFGYDEPNYTYAPNGKKLLGELAAANAAPPYVRVHNLFTTGDSSASLKWGSTNIYTEDASGRPVYNWEIVDRIFDTFQASGVKPLVEIGFMPEALSTHPEPYRHNFPQEPNIFTGWAYPPKDYQKWSDLVFQFVHHLRDRYGDAEVKTWLWEVWNEPDIPYWKGTPEEFFKLYDFTVDAALRALPDARIGGPESTGPANPHAAEFLRAFLEHCAHGKNYANGKTGSRLDFISFHPKGAPTWQGDHVQMGISHQLVAIEHGFKIVASFPEWQHTPIILGESDPEGCAACSAKQNPQNSYRNGPLYAAYTVEVVNNILALTGEEHVIFFGAVTWAFEFEDQPYFAGFRELATNGIDKPVLNAFRMLGLLGNDRIQIISSGALESDQIVREGVRAQPDIGAIATRKEHEVEILIWNYHDDDVSVPDSAIDLVLNGLPPAAERGLMEHFRIDSNHSNAFTAWKEMGSPQLPDPQSYKRLESAGQLQLLNSPAWMPVSGRTFKTHFLLPRESLSLVRVSW